MVARLQFLPSASSIWRLEHCLAWPRLGEGEPHRSSTEEADSRVRMAIGSWCHEQFAARLRRETPPPLPERWTPDGDLATEEERAAAMAIVARWEEWWRADGDHLDQAIESPIAYHALDGTARALLLSGARAYEEDLEAFEVPGTPDYACRELVGSGALAVVYDWKTTIELELPFARAAWAWQLRVYAVAWAALLDVDEVEVRTVQVGPDDVREMRTMLDGLQLAGIRGELRETALSLARSNGEPTPGPHCSGCRARTICPAGGALALEAVELVEPPAPAPGVAVLPIRFALARPESAAHAAWLWDRIGLAEAFLDGLRAEIRAWVADQPGGAVTFHDGRVAGMWEQNSRTIHLEAPGAFAALAGALGADAADAIAPRKTSQAAIERAVRERVSRLGVPGRGALKAGVDGALAALSAAGGLRESKIVLFKVKKPTKTSAPMGDLEARLAASLTPKEEKAR